MLNTISKVKVIVGNSAEEFEQKVNKFLEGLRVKPEMQYQKSEGVFTAMISYEEVS